MKNGTVKPYSIIAIHADGSVLYVQKSYTGQTAEETIAYLTKRGYVSVTISF